jgi:sec-independent protein translocase protein TatB
MLNIGFGEILLIAALLLVVVGPERLPGMLRQAGRWYAKLRRAANELQHAFMDEGDLLDAQLREAQGDLGPGRTAVPREPVKPPPQPRASDGDAGPADAGTAGEEPEPGPEPRTEPPSSSEPEPASEGPVDLSRLQVDETQGEY